MKKKITLKEIAKKCNVSTATVSFVINNKNRKGISNDTWVKIEKALPLKFFLAKYFESSEILQYGYHEQIHVAFLVLERQNRAV